jgi:hypothetical protein
MEEKKYRIKSLTSRGMKKQQTGSDDMNMNMVLPYNYYCKLKLHSVQENRPMKHLLLDAYKLVYGEATEEDVAQFEGKSDKPLQKIVPRVGPKPGPVEYDPFTGEPLESKVILKNGLGLNEVIPNPVAEKFFKRQM